MEALSRLQDGQGNVMWQLCLQNLPFRVACMPDAIHAQPNIQFGLSTRLVKRGCEAGESAKEGISCSSASLAAQPNLVGLHGNAATPEQQQIHMVFDQVCLRFLSFAANTTFE